MSSRKVTGHRFSELGSKKDNIFCGTIISRENIPVTTLFW